MPEPLTMELRLMLAARYVEDIRRLAAQLGRNLEHWLPYGRGSRLAPTMRLVA